MDKNMGAAFISTLLMIVVFAIYKYFKNFKNNQAEKETVKVKNEQAVKIKDFSSQVENLKSLRDSDVLSESEYKNKIDKINEEKLDDLVTKTDEYLRLKKLYNDGVFTKEEFEIKVKTIQNKINSEINKIAEYPIEKSTIESEEVYVKNQKPNSKLITILIVLLFFTLISILIIISQIKQPEPEINFDTPAVIIDTISDYNYKEVIKNKKYVYIIFNIEKPILKISIYEKISSLSTDTYTTPEDIYWTEWVKSSFVTEILEIDDYTEDSKNRTIDEMEYKLNEKLRNFDSDYHFDISSKCRDERKKEELKVANSKIIDINIYDFNTYSEASISIRNTKIEQKTQ